MHTCMIASDTKVVLQNLQNLISSSPNLNISAIGQGTALRGAASMFSPMARRQYSAEGEYEPKAPAGMTVPFGKLLYKLVIFLNRFCTCYR